MSLVLALLACVAVHLVLVDGRFPWRVGRLEPDDRDRRRDRPGRRPGRRLRGRLLQPPGLPRRRGRAVPAVDADVARCADLLVVAALAGHGVHGALAALADLDRSAGDPRDRPVGAALAAAAAEHERGRALATALDGVVDRVGAPARPLVAALQSTLATGTPLAPSLQRIADAGRARHRHRVQAQVRRLPVLLLLPLVALVLPAFAVVTLVPVAVATAGAGVLQALPTPPAPPAPPAPPGRPAARNPSEPHGEPPADRRQPGPSGPPSPATSAQGALRHVT